MLSVDMESLYNEEGGGGEMMYTLEDSTFPPNPSDNHLDMKSNLARFTRVKIRNVSDGVLCFQHFNKTDTSQINLLLFLHHRF